MASRRFQTRRPWPGLSGSVEPCIGEARRGIERSPSPPPRRIVEITPDVEHAVAEVRIDAAAIAANLRGLKPGLQADRPLLAPAQIMLRRFGGTTIRCRTLQDIVHAELHAWPEHGENRSPLPRPERQSARLKHPESRGRCDEASVPDDGKRNMNLWVIGH